MGKQIKEVYIGISMGARDILIKNGIEFLFTNIHTHHGMYPLYQNQIPYFWESENRDRPLVWSGEHYNLGNALGIGFNKNINFMTESYFGKSTNNNTALDSLHNKFMRVLQSTKETDILMISILRVLAVCFLTMHQRIWILSPQ